MDFEASAWLVGMVAALVAFVIAVWARSRARGGHASRPSDERVAALEEQVRGLLYRVWMLEQLAGRADVAARAPAPVAPPAAPAAAPAAPAPPVSPAAAEPAVVAAPAPSPAAPSDASAAAPRPSVDLEQRIGARWATWVGIVAILFAVSFFLKWSFDSNLLGPPARVLIGLGLGLLLLATGLALHRRRNVPYLSEGLAGLGLGVLYLSLFGAHAVYGLLGAREAFGALCAVTLLGAVTSVVSSRQITAVLTLLGGLLTPVLLGVERPDERNLLAYLLVLDLLVLAIAQFRTWPSLNRLAWLGTALLLQPILLRPPQHALSRLVLLSSLFALFLAVPLLRERRQPLRRGGEVDLLLVVANAAGYFWAVYVTLGSWQLTTRAGFAVALAVIYRAVAADHAARVPEDQATVVVHEGIAWTLLTLAIPLALDGPWVTLAWAAQGVALLWAAARARTPVAAWGGLAALLFAAARVVAVDPYWSTTTVPMWNRTYLIHLLVVAALAWGGALAGRARPERLRRLTPPTMRTLLWTAAPLVLAVLLWREPRGLWPAVLLTAELLVLAGLAASSRSHAFLIATPVVALMLLARTLGQDDALARAAEDSLISAPLLSRVAACLALAVAGCGLARSPAGAPAMALGRMLSGAAALALLVVLSVNWTRYQEVALREAQSLRQGAAASEIRWRTQLGLSVLWTLYAALALAWGFVRRAARLRYAALGLFGLTVVKMLVVDLSEVRTGYRIVSFLILGLVLLGVSLLYQKARRPVPKSQPGSGAGERSPSP